MTTRSSMSRRIARNQAAMSLAVEQGVIEQLHSAERGVLIEQHRPQHRLLGLIAPRRSSNRSGAFGEHGLR